MPTLLPDPSVDDHDPPAECVHLSDADALFDALTASTARDILAALYDEPTTASALADTLNTSVQNVSHHLLKLEAADLVTAVDTWYSEHGREMDVYAPTSQPLVLYAGAAEGADLGRQLGAD
jgi:DNA-binding transcriptional ArsR family regulator